MFYKSDKLHYFEYCLIKALILTKIIRKVYQLEFITLKLLRENTF